MPQKGDHDASDASKGQGNDAQKKTAAAKPYTTTGTDGCARHGHWIGGESPLRGELVATVSRRQLHVD